jgi:hypothetical protein
MRKFTTLETTVTLRVNKNIRATYALLAHPDVAQNYIPGVDSYTLLDNDWKQVSSRRRLQLEGGITALETIVEYSAPYSFTYKITDFSGLPLLAHGAINEAFSRCRFIVVRENITTVHWTFTFKARGYRHVPLLWIFLKSRHRTNMQRAANKLSLEL